MNSRHLGSQERPCAYSGPFKMTAAHPAMVPLATTQRQRHSIGRLRQVSTSRSQHPRADPYGNAGQALP